MNLEINNIKCARNINEILSQEKYYYKKLEKYYLNI